MLIVDRKDRIDRGVRPPLAAIAVMLVGCAYLAVQDPNNPSTLMPKCPTKLLTGLDCPFCGGLRMVHDVLHGDWSGAVHANIFLIVALPILVLFVARPWLPAGVSRVFARCTTRPWMIGLFLLIATWTVARNFPAFPLRPLG